MKPLKNETTKPIISFKKLFNFTEFVFISFPELYFYIKRGRRRIKLVTEIRK